MAVQTAETTGQILQALLGGMSRLSDKSLRKLAGCVEELIEEQEDAEDVAHIEALTPYDYENAIPFEDIVKEFEAEHGSLHQN